MLITPDYQFEENVVLKKSKMTRESLGHLNVAPEKKIAGDNLPEWGCVQFSISIPLPENVHPSSSRNELWPKPEKLDEGRYKGLFRVQTQYTEFRQCYEYSPMTFFHDPKSRFGETIACSTDGELKNGENNVKSYWWKTPAPVWKGNQRSQNQDTDEQLKFWFADEGETKYVIDENATVELAAFDIIQYPYCLNNEIHYQRFLVLHVVAVDCSSNQLETVSQSLTRLRSKAYFASTPVQEETPIYTSLLEACVRFVEKTINHEKPPTPFTLSMSRGGYIEGDPSSTNDSLFRMAQPARSVCAIPNITMDNIDVPQTTFGFAKDELKRYKEIGGEKYVDKVKASLWGAQLSAGYDTFAHEIPTTDSILAMTDPINDYAYWSITAEGAGISAVRKSPELGYDISLWSLSSTRFIDLIMLSQRAFMALHHISQSLREIPNIDTTDLNFGQNDDISRWEEHRDRLMERVNNLLKVQNEFAEVRNNLWFNAVPRRQLDTFILLCIREEMGIQNLYDDLIDEVKIRQEVYNLTYHEYDTQFRTREAKIAEQIREENRKAEEARKQQREAMAAVREKQDKRNNVMLFVVATAVAIPGYIALTVEDGVHLGGTLLLISALLLTAIAIFGSPYFVGKWHKYTEPHQQKIDRYLSRIDKPVKVNKRPDKTE